KGELETLPHVLNHCPGRSRGWQLRHDAVGDRIVKALSTRDKFLTINQPVGEDDLRPDFVFQHGKNIYIIDVTIPFENRLDSFEKARQRKIDKYATLIDFYAKSNLKAFIVPIVVGALGSWDTKNDKFLLKFMSKSYLALFQKLCVSDCIKWSRDIYIEHQTGKRQFQDPRPRPQTAGHTSSSDPDAPDSQAQRSPQHSAPPISVSMSPLHVPPLL
ncbi:hypothetical protein AVEN_198623-1, partial [Araneus ventricosus]